MAASVVREHLREAGLDHVEVTSAGTGSWHVGEPADKRARATLKNHGYPTGHTAAQVGPEHLDADLLVALDQGHARELRALIGDDERIRLLRGFDPDADDNDVPDPYYDGSFTEVLTMIEAAAQASSSGSASMADPKTIRSLGGDVRLVELDGELLVVKPHDGAEGPGLRWLGEVAPVPEVKAADDHLITAYIPGGEATKQAAEDLGRNLARMHSAGAPAFGAPPPGGPEDAWIGKAPMRNIAAKEWPEWFAEHRIRPYLKAAVDRQAIADPKPIEQVCRRIQDLAGAPEPPARLHGDLWSGNVLWSKDGAYLIDPAAHGGHRESDLAMLQWFACPHVDRVLAAYDEANPLATGWQVRVPLHQLFPQLVHAALFGGGYGQTATTSARKALRST